MSWLIVAQTDKEEKIKAYKTKQQIVRALMNSINKELKRKKRVSLTPREIEKLFNETISGAIE